MPASKRPALPEPRTGALPKTWLNSVCIECVPGTRWYVERNHQQALQHWLREIGEAYGDDLLPMQWAPAYIGVSRTAVRNRVMADRLTAFTFSLEVPTKTLLGRVSYKESRTSFDYLLKSECDAWRDELFEQREDERALFEAERERRMANLPRAHRR